MRCRFHHVPRSADYQLFDKLLLPEWAETDGMAVDDRARSPITRAITHDQLIVSWLMSSSYLSELKLMGWPLIPLQEPMYLVLIYDQLIIRHQLTDKLLLPKWPELMGCHWFCYLTPSTWPFIHDQLIVSWLMSSSYLSELKLMGWPLIPLQGPPFLVSMFNRTRLNSRNYCLNVLWLKLAK